MKQLLIITLLSLSMIGIAQSKYFEQSLEWQASGNHNANSVLEDEHGNYVLVGSLKNVDIPVWRSCLIKTDNYGNLLDTVEYLPAPNHETVVWDLVIDTINHTYAMSGFINNYDIDPPNSDAYFLLTDTMGNILQETFINNSDTVINCSYVLYRANDGGYMLAGFSWPNNPNYRRMPYMARLNATGAYVWDSAYVDVSPGTYAYLYGGNKAKNGNYYVCGIVNLTIYDTKDGYVAEIDDTGNIVWQQIYSGASIYDQESINDVIDSYEGGLAIAGMTEPDNEAEYGGLMKTDSVGNVLWSNLTHFKNGDAGGGLIQLPDSSYVLSGSYVKSVYPYDRDAEIVKFSKSGEHLWTRHYGNEPYDEYIYDMIASTDGSLVFCGRQEHESSVGAYFLKTNCMGLLTLPQANFYYVPLPDSPQDIVFFSTSQYVYSDSLDGGHYIWDFGDGSPLAQSQYTTYLHTYAVAGVYNITLTAVVCNDTSRYTQTICVGSPSFAPLFSYQTNNLTATFINQSTGVTQNQGTFSWNFGDGATSVEQNPMHTYTQSGSYTVELQAIVCNDTLIYRQTVVVVATGIPPVEKKMWTISPNPADTQLTINSVKPLSVTFVLYDVLGRDLAKQTLSSTTTQLSTAHLPAGVYLYQIINPQKQTLQYGKLSILH